MTENISRTSINLNVIAPDSKSMFQRAVLCATLAQGVSEIEFNNLCLDSVFALKAAARIGAKVSVGDRVVKITGGLKLNNPIIDVGESAFALRNFSIASALLPGEKFMVAQGTLSRRDSSLLLKALNLFGADAEAANSKPPIRIHGLLKPGIANIDFSSGSQVLSGLLTSLPTLNGNSQIKAVNLKSKGYVDLTLDIMNRFGVNVVRQGYETFDISGNQTYQPTKLKTEGDWSGAAFLLVAGAVAGAVSVSNLSLDSYQPDKAIYRVLKNCGADISLMGDVITVKKSEISGFEYDATDSPDLFPALVALALNANSVSRIKGVARLANKESDRGEALVNEFSKIGADIKIQDDFMIVNPCEITGGEANSRFDHRIAMALAVAGLNAANPVDIINAECVAKSYPDFFKIFNPEK